MTLKIDAKFEEKLIFTFKHDKNLVKLDLSTCRSPKLVLSFAPIVQSIKCLTYKITEELSFMTLKGDAKFEEKLTCGLENDMRNIANFHQST